MRVLDWGSGSGVAVEALRSQGWHVFGADIDEQAVALGNELLRENRLAVLDDQGRAPFPDGYFHFVYSQAVFEHIADPAPVAQEIRRLTAMGGLGFHVLPAPFRPIEPHIFIPLVHWLPKNRLRWLWILACCLLHVGLTSEINQRAVRGMSLADKVTFEYRYLNEQTFYRSARRLAAAFERAGFVVRLPILDHPSLHRFRRILMTNPIRLPAQLLLLAFVSIHIQTEVAGYTDRQLGVSHKDEPQSAVIDRGS